VQCIIRLLHREKLSLKILFNGIWPTRHTSLRKDLISISLRWVCVKVKSPKKRKRSQNNPFSRREIQKLLRKKLTL
jgi:hypothetical protein